MNTVFSRDHTAAVLQEVMAERDYQRSRFSDDSDNSNTAHNWVAFIVTYLGKANTFKFDAVTYRKMMVKVAALAVAAVEWVDRTRPMPFHFDGIPTTTSAYAPKPE